MKGIRGKPGRPRPLTSFDAGGIFVDIERSLNIVIRSPRLGDPDVVIHVTNLDRLRRALDLAEARRDEEEDERQLRWT